MFVGQMKYSAGAGGSYGFYMHLNMARRVLNLQQETN